MDSPASHGGSRSQLSSDAKRIKRSKAVDTTYECDEPSGNKRARVSSVSSEDSTSVFPANGPSTLSPSLRWSLNSNRSSVSSDTRNVISHSSTDLINSSSRLKDSCLVSLKTAQSRCGPKTLGRDTPNTGCLTRSLSTKNPNQAWHTASNAVDIRATVDDSVTRITKAERGQSKYQRPESHVKSNDDCHIFRYVQETSEQKPASVSPLHDRRLSSVSSSPAEGCHTSLGDRSLKTVHNKDERYFRFLLFLRLFFSSLCMLPCTIIL